jgi:rhodanese-related sulfurtransferase
MGKFFITAEQVWSALGGAEAPLLVDVRRRAVYEADGDLIPGARWRDPADLAAIADAVPAGRDLVIYCAHAHQLSQGAAALLRAQGREARVLRGGIEAWRKSGLPTLRRAALAALAPQGTQLWVTRRRPKIDRIACPWLILRFIDPDARFLFVEPDEVLPTAEELGAIAFDIEGAPITHDGALCSFDTLLAKSGIADPALAELAVIVRGADTARPELAPESAGLLAMAIGISALAGEDDHMALRLGLTLYDALYAWRRKAPAETHNWPTVPAAVPA